MTNVLLYWNHICVLHKKEKQFLEKLTKCLYEEGIHLEVRFFGLGYPEHMSEYLARPDAILPDIIISTDLEVFEDVRIFQKYGGELYPAARWIPLRNGAALEAVWRGETLLPFLSIPLVYYTREPALCEQTSLRDWEQLAFGGINNSAAKTVVKTVWSHWGKASAQTLLSKSLVTDMPIGAFQTVRSGDRQTALVPSIYALRADFQQTFLRIPQEGPVLIPSYLGVRTSISETVARRVIEGILCPELCGFYAEQGDLILYPACVEIPSRQESERYLVPTKQWFQSVAPEEFYAVYCRYLPTAKSCDIP